MPLKREMVGINIYWIVALIVFIAIIVVLIVGMMFPESSTRTCTLEESCYRNQFCVRPSNPKNIRADVRVRNTIKLGWDPVQYAQRYTIYRHVIPEVSRNNFQEKVIIEGIDNTRATLENLTLTPQYIMITATNLCGESVHNTSHRIDIRCHADTPTNLEVSFWMANLAIATWNEVPDAISYNLYVNTILVYSGSIISAIFSTDVPGNYSVQVSSVNACGESALTDIVVYEL